MYRLWENNRRSIVIFVAICAGVLFFPVVAKMIARYYLSHAVVIPFWARTLILTGAFVRMFSLRIDFAAAAFLFAMSSVHRNVSANERAVSSRPIKGAE
jgi:hypothetical protein